MGACFGTTRNRASSSRSVAKNQRLRSEKPRWQSDVPLTETQLNSKRDEFWHTAPSFEGRREIWDALLAAANALEAGDHALAQAIIDGANITLPHGSLLECYDELGARYQLPHYVLSAPVNLATGETTTVKEPEAEGSGPEVTLRLRLSHNAKDVSLTARAGDSVLTCQRRLATLCGVEPGRQRWCVAGRLLSSSTRLKDARIPQGGVVQVLVTMPLTSSGDRTGGVQIKTQADTHKDSLPSQPIDKASSRTSTSKGDASVRQPSASKVGKSSKTETGGTHKEESSSVKILAEQSHVVPIDAPAGTEAVALVDKT